MIKRASKMTERQLLVAIRDREACFRAKGYSEQSILDEWFLRILRSMAGTLFSVEGPK